MNWLKKAWHWLDGKKRMIGSACLIAANYIPRDKTAYVILAIAGEVLGGVGIVHAIQKEPPSGLSKMKTSLKNYWHQSTGDPE